MSEETALLGAIAAGDDTARLAYADWLEERGDARAAWVRDRAVWRWMRPDGRDPLPGLIEALGGEEWERASEARGALTRLGGVAVAPLVELLTGDELRATNAAWALEGMSRADIAPALPRLMALLNEQDAAVRGHAIIALRAAGPDAAPAVPALIGVLSEEGVSGMVEMAAETLGRIGPAAVPAVPFLCRLLPHEYEAANALTAIGAGAVPLILEEMFGHAEGAAPAWLGEGRGYLSAAEPLRELAAQAEGPLRDAFARGDVEAKEVAALALIDLDPALAVPEVIAGLVRHAGRETDGEFAAALASAGVACMPERETLRRLLPALTGGARASITGLLARLGDGQEVAARLLDLLGHPDPAQRASAAFSLGYLDHVSDEAVHALLPLFRDDPEVRVSAMATLGQACRGSRGGLLMPSLLEMAELDDEVGASLAARMLADSADPRAEPALRRLLTHESAWVQASAAPGVGGPGQEDLAETLVRLARSEDAHAASVALRALCDTGPLTGEVAEVVRSGLADDRVAVRAWAVRAAGVRGPAETGTAGELVRLAREEPVSWVRAGALEQVPYCGLSASEAVALLRERLAEDGAGDVRRSAACCLGLMAEEPAGREAAAAAVPELLGHLYGDNAGAAAQVLWQIGAPAAPGLLRVLAGPEEAAWAHACLALSSGGDVAGRVCGLLPKALGCGDAGARFRAAWLCYSLGPAAVSLARGLLPLACGEDVGCAEAALVALGQIGARGARAEAAALVGHANGVVAAAALWAACRLGDGADALPLLRAALEAEHDTVRGVARVELAGLGEGAAPSAAERLAAGVVWALRDSQREELMKRGAEAEVFAAVAEAARSTDYGRQGFGLHVLSWIARERPADAVACFAGGLGGYTGYHKVLALWILRECGAGSRVAHRAARDCLDDGDPAIRLAAVAALRRLLATPTAVSEEEAPE